jgi:hypothetical protein
MLLPWVLTFDVALSGTQWSLIVAFGVVQLGIPYILFARGVRSVAAQEASLITILEAVLNPIWVWMLIGEAAPAATWIGGTLIVCGLILRYTVFAPAALKMTPSPDEAAGERGPLPGACDLEATPPGGAAQGPAAAP